MSVTLEESLATNINVPIDPVFVSQALSRDPWKQVDHVPNCRDIAVEGMRKNYVFRSDTLEFTSEQGKQDLAAIGVKTIFDLRSTAEIEANSNPRIKGTRVQEVALTAATTPAGAPKFTALPEVYMDMLTSHKATWTAILKHIGDDSGACLMHCTGGKDRTGVAAALILSLVVASHEDIADEYAPSRLGIEPAREALTAKITSLLEVPSCWDASCLLVTHLLLTSDVRAGCHS
ncbi:uncharacterized protein LTR77_010527 [Saxophila tyrrhenica]|uniref:Tyrosine specific protein phosphatases domain-containing protein n=1 Tax=Saxophila tyrrhenica TaxID=1690608 RepID=A0AAV9NXN8_9PEZI|nr:hypothetical protein LTR77_010527 [Saxophila tyrrhenica]